ncbi:MAG: hypothetical protein JXP34_00555, partial [Planctomycetes bacterium]|nr:hypothetical protein [Planctomycetota bacterium]
EDTVDSYGLMIQHLGGGGRALRQAQVVWGSQPRDVPNRRELLRNGGRYGITLSYTRERRVHLHVRDLESGRTVAACVRPPYPSLDCHEASLSRTTDADAETRGPSIEEAPSGRYNFGVFGQSRPTVLVCPQETRLSIRNLEIRLLK